MTTLFEITHRVASELRIAINGKATGGSTTTLIDKTLLDRYPADYFCEGTIWVVQDAGGASAAPEGEWGTIKNFENQTATVTTQETLTAAIASGDYYKIAPASYPLYAIRDAVNRALDEIGMVDVFDKTSLTAAAAQTEYTLPVANIHVKRVLLQGNTNDSNDNNWLEVTGWYVEKTATASADTLVLKAQPPTGHILGIVYTKYHPAVYDSDDTIDERMNTTQLVMLAAIKCVEDKLFIGDPDPKVEDQLNVLRQRYAEMGLNTPKPAARRHKTLVQHLTGANTWENFTVNNN